jgi:hypothetical protein
LGIGGGGELQSRNPEDDDNCGSALSETVSDCDDEIDEDGKGDERHRQRQANVHYTQHNFLDPLKLVSRLSGYPQLVGLYRILVTLPVTSCSAERSFSKLRIVKNRLRSSMCDEWLKCLMILAAEKDILSRLKNDDIIDRFAETSDDLAQVLRCL